MSSYSKSPNDVGGANADYEVGYARPPMATRFKPGQSGNPKGKPKGTRNLTTEFNDELKTKVTIQENGRTRQITKAQALAKQHVNKAVSGDARSTQIVLSVTCAIDAADAPAPLSHEADKQVKRALLRRMRQLGAGDNHE